MMLDGRRQEVYTDCIVVGKHHVKVRLQGGERYAVFRFEVLKEVVIRSFVF
jgi:hypothetical protein